jgi:hypothetical protein
MAGARGICLNFRERAVFAENREGIEKNLRTLPVSSEQNSMPKFAWANSGRLMIVCMR